MWPPERWLKDAKTPEERKARLMALRRLGTRHEGASGHYWEYPGPETLRLIRTWPVGWP